MVKPALFYLDVISEARKRFDLPPLATYSVSGEYSMLVNAVRAGILPEESIYEAVTSFFRAGADIVITYFAEPLARGDLSGIIGR